MKKTITHYLFNGFALGCLIFGLIMTVESKDVQAATTKYVTASALNIRKAASTSSAKVGTYSKGTKVTSYGTSVSWTKVKYRVIGQNVLMANPIQQTFCPFLSRFDLPRGAGEGIGCGNGVRNSFDRHRRYRRR